MLSKMGGRRDKRGQFGLEFSKIAGLIIMGIFLLIAIPLIITATNAATSGDIETSINTIISMFIPLFIFAIIIEFIRRFLQ